MSRPRILDLYCCEGGMAMGYHRAGFAEVVGVDIAPQPNYPFEFIQGDALLTLRGLLDGIPLNGYTLDDFDAIHASPPCQGYLNLGAVNRALGRAYDHPNLIAATRELLIETGKPYDIDKIAEARTIQEPIHSQTDRSEQ